MPTELVIPRKRIFFTPHVEGRVMQLSSALPVPLQAPMIRSNSGTLQGLKAVIDQDCMMSMVTFTNLKAVGQKERNITEAARVDHKLSLWHNLRLRGFWRGVKRF